MAARNQAVPKAGGSHRQTAGFLERDLGSARGGLDSSLDADTNGVEGGTYTPGYDAENRLVSVSGPGLEAQFGYDGDGRRVSSTWPVLVSESSTARAWSTVRGSLPATRSSVWHQQEFTRMDCLSPAVFCPNTRRIQELPASC